MKWLKLLIGIELLPFAWALSKTFGQTLLLQGPYHEVLLARPVLFFAGGFFLLVLVFFTLPKPMRLYVLGHELTHALWIWMMGGRVHRIKVTAEGGHVETDKTNFLIALAPYFFPIYTVLVVLLYGIASLVWNLAPWADWLYFSVGLTWAFHVVFTARMIPTVQPDITEHGWTFSLVVIYLANVLIVWGFILTVSPKTGWWPGLRLLAVNTAETYTFVILTLYAWIRDLVCLVLN